MNRPAKPRRRGLMLVLSSPSGAGKSTLSRSLIDKENLDLSISATTRRRRRSEAEGVHYHFVDPRTFAAMRDRGELLEWAEVHGNLYGTPRAAVETALAAGRDVLFDIDWQGTRQLAAAMPEDLVGIFVLPPSMAELRSRLERRAEDDHSVIDRRLANARAEIEHWPEYKYVLINDDLERSLDAARTILAVERGKREEPPVRSAAADRYRRDRQPELKDFVDGLLAERV